MPSQPPPESPAKGADSESVEDKVTRGNFEALAKGLFGVSREAIEKHGRPVRESRKSAKGQNGPA